LISAAEVFETSAPSWGPSFALSSVKSVASRTYPGREVPNPLIIDINKGEADINVVLKDILALTKLNYNTCIFGDGMPITLKFADAVGEILTAGPIKDVPPVPFGHYI
jgi:hypothetical protein